MKMSENASVKRYQDNKKKTHERYQSLSNEEKKEQYFREGYKNLSENEE